jgi:ABC-type Na+ efflux pump permease subunit
LDNWKEKLSSLYLLGGMSVVSFFSATSLRYCVTALSIWVFGVFLAVRLGHLKLLGPVCNYDMLRIGRRKSGFQLRALQAVLLGVIAAIIYYSAVYEWGARSSGEPIPLKTQAQVGYVLFVTIILTQFVLLLIITPGYVAGAISEEKERRTLEYVLATDLRGTEVIFGKLASRVLSLIMVVLAGLPVLGVAQLFGGIDPELLLYCYLTTIVTIIGVSSVSVLASILVFKIRGAISLAYLVTFGYIIGGFCLIFCVDGPTAALTAGFTILGYEIIYFEWITLFNSGNPLFMFLLYANPAFRTPIDDLFQNYAIFWFTVTATCLFASNWCLRSVGLRQMFGPMRTRRRNRPLRMKPAMTAQPMLWKELYGETKRRKFPLIVYPVVLFLIAWIIPAYTWLTAQPRPWNLTQPVGQIAREDILFSMGPIGMVVWAFLYLRITIRAASSVNSERSHHTLDELLTTPLTTAEIINGKLVGAVFGVRWHWIYLMCHYSICAYYQAMQPIYFIPMFLIGVIYAFGFAAMGLWISISVPKTLTAITRSILVAIVMLGAYMILAIGIFSALSYRNTWIDQNMKFLTEMASSWCPPWNAFFLSLPLETTNIRTSTRKTTEYPRNYTLFLCIGLAFWGLLIIICRSYACHRFNRLANRLPYSPQNPVQKI